MIQPLQSTCGFWMQNDLEERVKSPMDQDINAASSLTLTQSQMGTAEAAAAAAAVRTLSKRTSPQKRLLTVTLTVISNPSSANSSMTKAY